MGNLSPFPLISATWLGSIFTRLQRRRKIIVRFLWLLIVVMMFIVYAASIPDRNDQLLNIALHNRLALLQLNLSYSFFSFYNVALELIIVFVCFAVATLITWNKSDDSFACFTALMILLYGIWVTRPMETLTPTHLTYLPLSIIRTLEQILVLVFCYMVPTGRFVPRWTIPIATAWIIINGIWLFLPRSPFNGVYSLTPHRPLPFPSLLFSLLWYSTGVFAQVYRYRHTSLSLQRQQSKWIMFGVTGTFAGIEIFKLLNTLLFQHVLLLWYVIGEPSYYCAALLMPLSFGIAILQYQLWDINIIINRALVYTGLIASVIGIYVLVVGGLGRLMQATGNIFISLIATGVIAVIFYPLREYLERSVDHWMYGERHNPYKVFSLLGQRLGATLALEDVLQTIVETVALALKLPYAAIDLKQEGVFKTVRSYGEHKDRMQLTSFLLEYQGETIGHLLLSPRSAGESFTAPDRRLLNDLARQAGIALQAVRLNADLQRSRGRIVTAREEERRRLRRDLHDGLGSVLGALVLQVGSAHEYVVSTPPDISSASNVLTSVEKGIKKAVTDVRQLVYNLRPPALDELGLIAALHELVAQYNVVAVNLEKSKLYITIDVPNSLPPLSAAVEVAIYRIVQESVENVNRHAHAQHCLVRLTFSQFLCLEVIDDGIGISAEHHRGVGLLSIHERAAELGGTYDIKKVISGGTQVKCFLPLTLYQEASHDNDHIHEDQAQEGKEERKE